MSSPAQRPLETSDAQFVRAVQRAPLMDSLGAAVQVAEIVEAVE